MLCLFIFGLHKTNVLATANEYLCIYSCIYTYMCPVPVYILNNLYYILYYIFIFFEYMYIYVICYNNCVCAGIRYIMLSLYRIIIRIVYI